MGCCRGNKAAPPTPSHNSSICTKCGDDLYKLFLSTALHQTRGQTGTASVLIPLNCPKCNTVNRFKININRQVQR